MSALVLAVPVLLWRGLVTLPHRYDDLDAHGVPVRVEVTRCGMGQGGDSHHVGCRVRMAYAGRTETWKEGDLRGQESPDGTVAGVVDPQHPEVHALATEVDRRAGAGWHGPEVLAALLAALLAVVLGLVDLAVRPARRPGR